MLATGLNSVCGEGREVCRHPRSTLSHTAYLAATGLGPMLYLRMQPMCWLKGCFRA